MIRKLIALEARTIEGVSFEPGDVVAVYDSRVSPASLFGIMPPGWCSVEAIETESVPASVTTDVSSEEEGLVLVDNSNVSNDTTTQTNENIGPDADGLEALDLPAALKKALRENAAALEDDRLLNADGIKEWIAEGNDPDKDLEGVGPKFANILKEKYGS